MVYAGELSLHTTIASINSQENVVPRFVIIGNHPKHQAHERLYTVLNRYRNEHDFMIFLGADMELVRPSLLAGLGRLFDEFPRVEHILLGVQDWYSGEPQLGVNVWRRGVRHGSSPNALFTDLARNSARCRLKLERPEIPLILHGVDPSEAQAVRYGAQRGMKAAASGKDSRWERLADLVEYIAKEPKPQRMLALAGVEASLVDRALGARCIGAAERLREHDLTDLRERSLSPGLAGDLRAMVADKSLRERLARERADGRESAPEQRAARVRSRRRIELTAAERGAAERRLYELVATPEAVR